jgi:hypothetical protein
MLSGALAGGTMPMHAADAVKPQPQAPILIDGLMYPPGYRLGIDLGGVLQPDSNGDWMLLASEDDSLSASFHIRARYHDATDAAWWDRHQQEPDKWRLDSSTPLDGDVERRLFSHPNNNEAESGNAAFFVAFRTDNLFEGLDLRTHGPPELDWVDPTKTAYRRWRPAMERILGSARLRETVTLPQLLQEHGIAMEFAGFLPRALGAVLYLTAEPPPTPLTHEPPDAVISMGGTAPLAYLPDNVIATRADLVARMRGIMKIGNGRWVAANDIDWFLPPEFDARDRAFVEATGIGQTRQVGLRASYRKSQRVRTLSALDAVIESLRFL